MPVTTNVNVCDSIIDNAYAAMEAAPDADTVDALHKQMLKDCFAAIFTAATGTSTVTIPVTAAAGSPSAGSGVI